MSNLVYDQVRHFCGLSRREHTQVEKLLYNLNQRGIEADLLPWLQDNGLALMAYSSFDRTALINHPGLIKFAHPRGITAGQAALAWLLSHDYVIPIPKASHPDRVRENVDALEMSLTADDHIELDQIFTPPAEPQPLQIY